MFKKVYLEISNICNVQCSFCPVVDKDKKLMDVFEFETALKEVAPVAEVVCLHLLGEPLAHPRFSEILDVCEKYPTQIDLTTNGILIKRYQERILRSPSIRQVNFSIQAYKDNFPERDLGPYLLPLFEFATSAHMLRPELYINFRLWNQQSNDSNNEEVFSKIESHFHIAINRNVETGAIKSKRIWNRLYLHFDHIGIHADGTVVPCCLDKSGAINLGNVRQQSLQEILASERFVKMRDGFLKGVRVETFCQHCSFINRFDKARKLVQSV
jgi:radical SAM protein with 4Fe4S-binding SPASM domain